MPELTPHTDLPRHKPDPLPAIRPLPEYAVEGRRKQWYEEMKSVLQVPWMGVVTMAYAHYPNFFESLWRGLAPLAASREFVHSFLGNRVFVEEAVSGLRPPPILEELRQGGYATREIDDIRAMLEIFSHGNQPYLLIATLVRYLLEGHELTGPASAGTFSGRHGPDVQIPLILLEAHHADAPTRAIYQDIQQVLGLPFVNTDYRALARWPSYWASAWRDLREMVGGAAYQGICQACHDRCVAQVSGELPNPGGLSAAGLRAAAARDASVEEVLEMARLFQWLIPGLITNVAWLRLQLRDPGG